LNLLENLHQEHEKSQNELGEQSCYNQLSLAQKVSASQLRQFGFELTFIRGDMLESIAVFSCESNSVTVDFLEEVDSIAALYFRM